jgi:hypothetical protein
MSILRLIGDFVSDFERSVEAMLSPGSEMARPKEVLVKVRLVDLLPPELPGWPSKHPIKHR